MAADTFHLFFDRDAAARLALGTNLIELLMEYYWIIGLEMGDDWFRGGAGGGAGSGNGHQRSLRRHGIMSIRFLLSF